MLLLVMPFPVLYSPPRDYPFFEGIFLRLFCDMLLICHRLGSF